MCSTSSKTAPGVRGKGRKEWVGQEWTQGDQQQKAQSRELKQAECEPREPEMRKSNRDNLPRLCLALAKIRGTVHDTGTASQGSQQQYWTPCKGKFMSSPRGQEMPLPPTTGGK